MKYSIFYLTKYGFSVPFAQRLAEHNISLFNVYIKSKKTYELKNEVKRSYLYAKKFVEDKKIKFSKNAFDSIYILSFLGINHSNIDKLLENNIETLSDFYHVATTGKGILESVLKNKIIVKILNFIEEVDRGEEELELEVCEWLLNNQNESSYDLFNHMRNKFEYRKLFDFLTNLLYEKIIIMEKDEIKLKSLEFNDIFRFTIPDLDLVKLRVSGLTLEEIGKKYGITKERVRQRINKFFENFDTFHEDKYRGIFEKYHLNRIEFEILFKNNDAYTYLDLRYKKGEKSVVDIFDEIKFDKNIKQAILKLNSLMELEDTKIVQINYANIFTEFMYQNQGVYYTQEEIENQFAEFASAYIDLDKAKEISLRGIIDRSESIIRTNSSRFRYYKILDNDETVNLLNSITKYDYGVYGVQKIYDDNIEVMDLLELNDGYEFADLCNRYLEQENTVAGIAKIVRRSEIYFGLVDKKEFLIKIISQYEKRNVKEAAEYISAEYGVQFKSILSYITTEFSQYITNNIIIGFDSEISADVEVYLRKILIDEIYSEKLIRDKVNKHFQREYKFIPNYVLVKLGYKVENNTIYKMSLLNISSALKNYILRRGYYDKNDFIIPVNSLVEQVVRELEMTHDMIKVENGKFESIDYFEEQGLTKLLINNFLSEVETFGKSYKIFTLYHLMKHGFDHEILHMGFSEYTLNRLITTINKIQCNQMKNYMFSFESFEFSSYHILEIISKKYNIKTPFELRNVLRAEYGIDMKGYKINYLLEKGIER